MCRKETRSPDGNTSISRASCTRRHDYFKWHFVNNTQSRININKPAKPIYTPNVTIAHYVRVPTKLGFGSRANSGKIQIAYWSEMGVNAMKIDFQNMPKWPQPAIWKISNHFVNKILQSIDRQVYFQTRYRNLQYNYRDWVSCRWNFFAALLFSTAILTCKLAE